MNGRKGERTVDDDASARMKNRIEQISCQAVADRNECNGADHRVYTQFKYKYAIDQA